MSAEQFRERLTVTLSNGDRFRFQTIEPSSLLDIREIKEASLADRGYLLKVLGALIAAPSPATDKLAQMTDNLLVELVSRYLNLAAVRHKREHREQESIAIESIAQSRSELDRYLDEEFKRAAESSREVMGSFGRIVANMGGFADVYAASSIWNQLSKFQSLSPYTTLADQAERIRRSLQPALEGVIHLPMLDSIQAHNRLLTDSWITAQTNLTSMYSHIFDRAESIEQSLSATMRAVSGIDLPSVIRGWEFALSQNILEWSKQIQEEYRASFLAEANLLFLSDLSDQAIAEIVDDALDIPERQQQAFITRGLFKHTSQPEFRDALLETVVNSSRAKNRHAILESAHSAHTNRQFLLSIPVLLAQLDGLTVQFLAEMGFVRWNRIKKKWYEAEPSTGKYRMKTVYKSGQKTGKTERIVLKGLGDLSKYIPKIVDNPLPNTLSHVRDNMPQFRNQVMHGTMTDYGTSRWSSMLLLMVQIMSQQLRDLEASNQAV